ncbi:type IX secretion system motor protein PorM/GldM [Williamwhitmania taraxaci]|uniref:Gliding motility-associated protein GldM n=1 Tax=Williamwhitmania taraxaci TaxID=1640674 RepID=A0A1G6SPE2_9BACT|nr:gliding motility protein GldM [Williamwhitmania taraxaci]SDD18035.1 gliding motility-associated protein GldM [Williamwhitmania taraxaci]
MGHGKETPRQKMIGMMYLVLTAMLALNVSAEVLEAFVLVDQGLIQTSHSFASKNSSAYNEFSMAEKLNETKVKPWRMKADEIRKKTEEINKYIVSLKVRCVRQADGEEAEAVVKDKNGSEEVEGEKLLNKSDTDAGSRILLGADKNGEAYELRKKLATYRDFLLSIVEDKKAYEPLVTTIENLLDTKDPKDKGDGTPRTWETGRFESVPVAAILPILTKMQLDVLNCEAEIINYLLSQIDAGSFKFNKLQAIVIANSDYVLQGSKYEAKIFLAASDSTQDPEIFIGGYDEKRTASGELEYEMRGAGQKVDVKSGIGSYSVSGSKPGIVNWGGLLQIKSPSGQLVKRPFKVTYQVAVPSAVVSPSKMNVLYRGVDNPIDVSASGVSADKLVIKVENGSYKRTAKGYIVQPGQGKLTDITVFAEIDKSQKFLGKINFRVKNVPDPLVRIQGITGKSVDKVFAAGADGVKAEMPPDFDFDISYIVKSFTFSLNSDGYENSISNDGWRFNDKAKNMLSRLKAGNKITIEDIKIIGPDGTVRDYPYQLNVKIK